jgi:hypothetical protein
VLEASSIVWISLLSVCSAVESAELDELLEFVVELLDAALALLETVVDWLAAVVVPVEPAALVVERVPVACAWCAAAWRCARAFWAIPIWAGVTRSSRLSQARATCRGRRVLPLCALPRPRIRACSFL